MTDLTGTTLGRYTIEFLLTETPHAFVYRGFDTNLERIVVVHVIKPALVDTNTYTQDFSALVRRAVRLEHPGLLRVFDFVQLDGYVCVITEYIEGPALAQLLSDMRAARRELPLDEATRIVQQVAVAVDYAYAHGVRRVQPTTQSIKFKPDVLPFGSNGFRPVVTDLGLFLPLVTNTDSPNEAQVQEPEALDAQLRTLGALYFELVTGRAIDVAQASTETVRSVLQLYPTLSSGISALLQQLFSTQPTTQFSSIQAFVDAMIAPGKNDQGSVISLAEQYGQSSRLEHSRQQDKPQQDKPDPQLVPPAPPLGTPSPVNYTPPASATDLYSAETSIQLPLPSASSRQIIVTGPDGTQTIRDLPIGTLTIGRAQENQLILEDQRASRQHAKIEWDGEHCLLIDQNSRNGSYLNEERLTAYVPQPWTVDQIVRIGGHRLQLREKTAASIPADAEGAPRPALKPLPVAPPPLIMPPPVNIPQQIMLEHLGYSVDRQDLNFFTNSETVAVFCPEYRYEVAPGATQTLSLFAVNLGQSTAALLLNADGPWLSLSADRLSLLPQEQRPIEITITPPRDTRTRAGRYRVKFEAHNAAQEMQSVVVQFEVRVHAITDFSVQAQPEKVAAGDSIVIQVQNLGNEVRSYHLMWWDESSTLTFEPTDGNLTIAPGQRGEVTVRPVSPGRRWLGGAKRHPIHIQVTPDTGDNQVISVEVVNRSRLGI